MSINKQSVDFMKQALSAINLIEEPVSYQDYINQKSDVEEGRVKDWLLDMEADAAEMSKEEFIKAHGEKHADIWDRVQNELKYGTDESVEEDDDEYDQPASQPEAEMVDNQIAFIKYAVDEIEDNVKAGGEFPEWFQNKLSGVHETIKMLHAYMEGERRSDDQGEEEVEEKARSPYAIGMAKAMKMYKDKPPLSKKTIKKGHDIAKSIMGESTMTDNNKKKLSEGISIQTDTLEDQIALMAILKNAGLDPQQMNIQQQPSMNAPAPDMAPDAQVPAEIPGEEPEAEAFDNQPDEKFLDKDDFELKRNVTPNTKIGPSSAKHGDNPLPEAKAKPDYLDFDKDGDKKEPMKKALKDKAKKESAYSDTDSLIAELNKQYELMLIGGKQAQLGLTASARVIADEVMYDGSRFVVAEVVDKGEEGLVAEDGSWEGETTPYRVAYHIVDDEIVGQVGAGEVPYLSRDGNGAFPVKHKLNNLNLSDANFFEDNVSAVDKIKAMYEDLGAKMFGEVTATFGGCEMIRND